MNKPLLDIVNHAYKTVPFYKELLTDKGININSIIEENNFTKLPLVTKEMIQSEGERILSEKYIHYPQYPNLSVRRTSGSTGKYLKIYWNNEDNIRSLMELWYRRKKYFDISPNNKFCYFYTTDYIQNKLVEEKDISISPLNRSIGFSKNGLNTEKVREIYDKMYEFDPIWLMLQPSIAILLANCIQDNDLPRFKSLKYIELTGEFLLETDRARLTDIFQCSICNQYGCIEANSIASDFGDQQLHCHTSNVYIEIIKDGHVVPDGTEGDLYITSLTNYAMPLIRYKIGDKGRLLHSDSNISPILELTMGRVNEFVIDENNDKLPPYIFLRPIEHINEKLGIVINQFQVIQTGVNNFTVKLAVKTSYLGWQETLKKQFISNIKQPSLRNVQWNFEFTNHLFPENETGKVAYFYNRI
ncbi:MAG: putative phenylacetate-coenzyme ligase [Herbinix sp.]|jgi:phenylacetate-CoA ligase|nr:putative phenylacetate-coenzyme ligase [Herbinix sp.]